MAAKIKPGTPPSFIPRRLNLKTLLDKKSHFLLGPRQTGKSFLIRHTLRDARIYNLLDNEIFLSLSQSPERLAQEISPKDRIVVIDEIQRLPQLLNEVHRLIEEKGVRFLLTGSSARKLRRGGVNLLGGRARTKRLHPLTAGELGSSFDLSRALRAGLLPSIYFPEEPDADLGAYAGSYLQEEIAAEGATRNVPAFSRFLKVAALCNASIVNFTNVANDAQVARTTVYEYFEILRDTMILHELPAWKASLKRKPLVSSKYYFFDVGVARSLQGRVYAPETAEFGQAFETYLMHELICYRDYVSGNPLSFWRSASGFEVDFILGDHTAIEVKAKKNVSSRDIRSIRALADEKKFKRLICASLETRARRVGGVLVLPYQEFLRRLWTNEFK